MQTHNLALHTGLFTVQPRPSVLSGQGCREHYRFFALFHCCFICYEKLINSTKSLPSPHYFTLTCAEFLAVIQHFSKVLQPCKLANWSHTLPCKTPGLVQFCPQFVTQQDSSAGSTSVHQSGSREAYSIKRNSLMLPPAGTIPFHSCTCTCIHVCTCIYLCVSSSTINYQSLRLHYKQ